MNAPTIMRSPEIERREEFAPLCNRMGLRGYAVEVGTERAEFASQFRAEWEGNLMLCIDPWKTGLDDYDELQWERESDYAMALQRLVKVSPPHKPVEVFRGTVEAALKCSRLRRKPDFVYLDGNHTYEHVVWEIEQFWNRMSPGGILAGHDYDLSHYPGVVRAVQEFSAREGVPVYITPLPVRYKSWYAYKEPPSLYDIVTPRDDPEE